MSRTGGPMGPYALQKLAHRRSGSESWLAIDTQRREPVLVTVLAPSLARSPGLRALLAEARSAAALSHPNLVRLIGVEQHGGRTLLVQEWSQGPSFAYLLERVGRSRARLPTALVLDLLLAACEGLALAHHQSPPLVHGALSPERLFISHDGQVRVRDLGIAWATHEDDADAHGLAPEGPLSPAADVYALGHLARTLDGDVPDDLDAVLQRCLDPDPEARYLDAGMLASALGALRGRYPSRTAIGALRQLLLDPDSNPEVEDQGAWSAFLAELRGSADTAPRGLLDSLHPEDTGRYMTADGVAPPDIGIQLAEDPARPPRPAAAPATDPGAIDDLRTMEVDQPGPRESAPVRVPHTTVERIAVPERAPSGVGGAHGVPPDPAPPVAAPRAAPPPDPMDPDRTQPHHPQGPPGLPPEEPPPAPPGAQPLAMATIFAAGVVLLWAAFTAVRNLSAPPPDPTPLAGPPAQRPLPNQPLPPPGGEDLVLQDPAYQISTGAPRVRSEPTPPPTGPTVAAVAPPRRMQPGTPLMLEVELFHTECLPVAHIGPYHQEAGGYQPYLFRAGPQGRLQSLFVPPAGAAWRYGMRFWVACCEPDADGAPDLTHCPLRWQGPDAPWQVVAAG